MKFNLLLLICGALLSLSLAACSGGNTAQSQPSADAEAQAELPADKDYRIVVSVPDFPNDTLYLGHYFGLTNQVKDTAIREASGDFVFAGDEALPQGMYLVIFPPRNSYFEMMVGRDQHFTMKTDTSNYVVHMKVEGSEENEVMYRDVQFLSEQRKKANELKAAYEALPEGSPQREEILSAKADVDTLVYEHRRQLHVEHSHLLYAKFLKAMKAPDPVEPPPGADEYWQFYRHRRHFFDAVDFSDDRLLRTVALGQKVEQYMESFVPKAPDSIIQAIDLILGKAKANDDVFQYFTAHLLNTYGIENKLMGMDAVLVHMVEKYYLSGDAWWADSAMLASLEERARALSPNLVGRPAKDFTASDLNGKPRSLYSVKAPYTILYFWDYDCGHCKTVTPILGELYPRFKDRGVALYAVSINGAIDTWKEKVNEYGLGEGINVQDHRRTSGFDQYYDIRSTPRIFVLDKDKIIRYKQITVEQLEEVLTHELEGESGVAN